MEHNKLFGTIRELLNLPTWQAKEEQRFKQLIKLLYGRTPEIYQSRFQPYIEGQKQFWHRTVLTAHSMGEIELFSQTVPWANWQYTFGRPGQVSWFGLDELKAHPHHQKLVGLNFSCLQMGVLRGSHLMDTLMKHALIKQLHTMSFATCKMNSPQLTSLLSRRIKHMTHLDLSGNGIDANKMSIIFEADLSQLKTLKLNDNHINNLAAYWLARAPHLYNLERLELKNNRISGKGKRWLSESLVFPNGVKIVY